MNPWAPTARHEGVSVLIKAYNEEARILLAVRSALAAAAEVAPLPLEVVVADSLSADATVALACEAAQVGGSVRVVQLRDPGQRGCGTGTQLGYEWACGRWLLLMDADMQLAPGFLAAALAHLQQHPRVAGVGGRIAELRLRNGSDRIRQRRAATASGSAAAGPASAGSASAQPWLEGGGLYRREALAAVDDLVADPRLSAFEEADLGMRLQRAGWALQRLPRLSMHHEGHETGTVRLLWGRFRSGRLGAAGVLMRLAWQRRQLKPALPLLQRPLLAGLWWAVLPLLALLAQFANGALPSGLGLPEGAPAWPVLATGWMAASSLGVGALLWRHRDPVQVLAAVLDWHLTFLALLPDLSRPLPPRPLWVPARLVVDTTPSAVCTPAWREADPLPPMLESRLRHPPLQGVGT